MQIDEALFKQMLSALLNSQESLTYFCHLHPNDDAADLALISVNQAIRAANNLKMP
jgi:hypothetical protein